MTIITCGHFEIHAYQQVGGLFCATGWVDGSLRWNVEGRTLEEAIQRAKAKVK